MQRALTLADHALGDTRRLASPALVGGAALLTALATQIAIPLPWTPVPITGQTFAVLLSGALLGARRGFLAQALYLLMGAAGAPIFSGGRGGLAVLAGPTAGYLIAFPLAAAITGALAERGWDRRTSTMLAAMLLGSSVIFGSGLAVLSLYVPREALLQAGLLPFLPGDVIKSLLAALALPATWRRLRGEPARD